MNVALIVGLVFFLLGAIFLIVGIVATRRSKTAQTWPFMPATVLRSEVVRHEETDDEGNHSVSFEPVVEYQYAVMGQLFTGTRIAFGANRFDSRKAAEIAARYPVGSKVNVHYNPDKPKDAVLETTASSGKLFTIIGAIFAAIGVVVIIIGFLV